MYLNIQTALDHLSKDTLKRKCTGSKLVARSYEGMAVQRRVVFLSLITMALSLLERSKARAISRGYCLQYILAALGHTK